MTAHTIIRYDEHGVCTSCHRPGNGFVNDGVCMCLDEDVPFEPVIEPADPVCCWCWLALTEDEREVGAHSSCIADMQHYVR